MNRMSMDPASLLRSSIAAQIDAWAEKTKPKCQLMLVLHPVVEVIDLETADLYMEVSCDVIEKQEPPFTDISPNVLTTLRAHVMNKADQDIVTVPNPIILGPRG